MAERPKKPAASRDPRLAYRPIVTTTPATTSVTTPPTSGGAPLVPPGYYHPTGDERGSRQAGEKGRRSSSSEDEDEPRKRRDTAKTPSPTGPEEGGGEEMASSSSASSSTSSSQASADSTPPSRSTSYVELESLRAAGVANPAETETGGTAAAMSVTAAVGRRDTAAGNQGRPSLGAPTSINISFAEAAALPRASPTPLPRTSPRPGTSRTWPMPTATSTPGHDGQVAPPAPSTTKAKNYPPLIVDKMPNWTAHFQKLHDLLGHAPNGRPFGQGVRFIPHSPEEFRTIQKYLSEATQADPAVQWFCYSADAEKPAKVAIRGLPPDTDPEEIKRALTELDFACVRCAGDHMVADCDRPRQDTPKCADCGRDHAASSKKCPHFRKEARKRNVRMPPPPPGTERLPTRAVRSRTQAPQPPLGREPQILAAPSGHQEVPIETKANDPTEPGAPLPTKRKHRGGKKHKKPNAGVKSLGSTPPTALPPQSQRGRRRRRTREPKNLLVWCYLLATCDLPLSHRSHSSLSHTYSMYISIHVNSLIIIIQSSISSFIFRKEATTTNNYSATIHLTYFFQWLYKSENGQYTLLYTFT
ncbi:hypothetical protein K1T71_014911 [Dendrolimus kikuchii]|nr:hypothetical protein K1T71_014911 [Dendrolimus kikuchii]